MIDECFLACLPLLFSHHSVTVAGIRSPGMRKQTHDDLISNFGETPSDPRCELLEHWFVHFCPPFPPHPLSNINSFNMTLLVIK